MPISETKILIIDDDLVFLEILKCFLTSHDYVVSTVSEVIDILRIVEKFKPDIILLDIYLDNYDGRTVSKIIRSNEDYKTIPIILCSVDESMKESIFQCGANAFVKKPLDLDLLASIIKELS